MEKNIDLKQFIKVILILSFYQDLRLEFSDQCSYAQSLRRKMHFCTEYDPAQLKWAQVIMLLKLGKPTEDITSYRPISLLLSLSKLLEKPLLVCLKPIIKENNLMPEH